MKAVCVALLLSLGALSAPADARGRGHSFHSGARVVIRAPVVIHRPVARAHFFFAAPIVAAPLYYNPPPAYYPYYPPVVAPSAPQYIEEAPPAAPADSYWYYCGESAAYYPYARECPGGWQVVSPKPS